MTDKKKKLSKCTTRKDVEEFFLSRGIPKNHFETRSIALLALMGNPQMSFVGFTTDKQKYEMVLESFLCGTWKYAEQLKQLYAEIEDLKLHCKAVDEVNEKMKCSMNCKHSGTDFCMTNGYCVCDKWELKE